jgi:peroxiredoxin (alkyl hydroperoxide reductase subunit C)
VAAEVGEKAPGFTLPADDWEYRVSREKYTNRGPVALFFYSRDWSSVCTHQMGELQAGMGRFEEKGASVLAINADSPWSHRASAADQGREFQLLANVNMQVIEDYGVRHEPGSPECAYLVIDCEGLVRTKRIESSPKDQPEVGGVFEDLDKVL